jgi:hypothetical protein
MGLALDVEPSMAALKNKSPSTAVKHPIGES